LAFSIIISILADFFRSDGSPESTDLTHYQIILEIKSVKDLNDIHRAQMLNYLRATQMKLGMLVNFGSYPKVTIERIAA